MKPCKFNISAILVMAPIALASMMEHIGDMSAISATVGENLIEDPGLHRTLIGDGLATSLSALVGGPANTTYGENTGVLELSKVHDPKVIRIAAVYAIILSFIPKMAEVIGSMPSAIIGGVSFMLYGMISAIGVRNVVENRVDFTKSRNLIIAGVIFVCGLGFSDGLTFNVANTDITLTSLAIAAIAGIVLNAILPGNDYHFGKNAGGDANRGIDMIPNFNALKTVHRGILTQSVSHSLTLLQAVTLEVFQFRLRSKRLFSLSLGIHFQEALQCEAVRLYACRKILLFLSLLHDTPDGLRHPFYQSHKY